VEQIDGLSYSQRIHIAMLLHGDAKQDTMRTVSKYPGLQTQPGQRQSRNPIFIFVRRFLRAQFGCPTGYCGKVAGTIMAWRPSNNARIRWTVSLLDVRSHDRILEVGMGPGIAIELLSQIAVEGFVAGIDHSDVMVRQATKRNAKAIRGGRVLLELGSAARLPQFDQPFDKIFTINSIHFWSDPIDCLKALRRLLKPGGLMAITIQPRSRGATDDATRLIGEELVADLECAGFSGCRLEMRKAFPVSVACALGVA
jgi:SAM-dependent methyltransferase